jgi:sec-independent protein translocase protein TatA
VDSKYYLCTPYLNRYYMTLLAITPQLLLSMPSGGEWITILLVVVVLFGGKKIPELARGLGKGIREFNDAKTGIKDEIESGIKEKEKTNA